MEGPDASFYELDASDGYSLLWSRGIRGQGVTVAILDTGVSALGDLQDHVVTTLDFTDDGNPVDSEGHGSLMANSVRLVAPGASIASLKVLPSQSAPSRRSSIEALHYCIEQKQRPQVALLALSFPTHFLFWTHKPKRCALCQAVVRAVEAGIHVVVAAGNQGKRGITCPATAGKCITVAATASKHQNKWLEDLSYIKRWWLEQSGEFGQYFGTSFSAAYVAGAVALVLSAAPRVSPGELKTCMSRVGRRSPGMTRSEVGAGQVNVEDLLACLITRNELDQRFPRPYTRHASYREAFDLIHQYRGSRLAQGLEGRNFLEALQVVIMVFDNLAGTPGLSSAEVREIRSWLVPGYFPDCERRLDVLVARLEAPQSH